MEMQSPVDDGMAPAAEGAGPRAAIAAWREQGVHRFDPVRFRFIEALARRTADHRGDARRMLDDKLAKLVAAYGDDVERARCAGHADVHAGKSTKRQQRQLPRGALAELVDHIKQHALPHTHGSAAGGALSGVTPFPELKAVSYFKSTWVKLSADQWLTQSMAKVPENAGPLHSHQLVHRALTLMRDLSPEYLNRFMSYVDTLLWLDQARGQGVSVGDAAAPRAESQKKPVRGKGG